MRSTDPSLHYRHPPASAFRLNKLLYRVRMDDAVRQQFIANPESVIAGSELSDDEIQAVKELDVNALSALGAHPLLAFMARFNVEHDRRTAERAPSP
ncbi:MAG: Os1348 family NHLP clan protein [Chloroflexota bacterium]